MIALLLVIAFQVTAGQQVEPAQGPVWDRILARLEENSQTQDERFVVMKERLNQLSTSIVETRASLKTARDELKEVRQSWRPLQDLVDRIIALGWKLILAVMLFGVLIEGTRLLFLWLVQRWFKTIFKGSEG